MFLEEDDSKKPTFTKQTCINFFKHVFNCTTPLFKFAIPSWFTKFKAPIHAFNDTPPTYLEISNIVRKMKSSGSPNPLDQIPIIAFKRSPYLCSYLTNLIEVIWRTKRIPPQWRGVVNILIHKKDSADDPSSFRTITLQSISLKVFTSGLRNRLLLSLMKNDYIETSIQKSFTLGMSSTFEHTAHLAHLIRQAKRNQSLLL